MNKKTLAGISLVAVAMVGLTACTDDDSAPDQMDAVKEKAAKSQAYIPQNDVELNNYNRAQELYDNPASIQWCSAFPSSNSAPIITTPIAGKLTTSATSYFSPTETKSNTSGAMVNIPSRSVDGLFHGESHYRYGFSPSGHYVEFSNSMETLCTTALTDFQRQNTYVEGIGTNGDASEVDNLTERQSAAEEALKSGDPDKAVEILEGN